VYYNGLSVKFVVNTESGGQATFIRTADASTAIHR
jgi:hypothetical protein